MTDNQDLRQYVKQKTTKSSIIGRIIILAVAAGLLAVLSGIKALESYMIIIALGTVLITSAIMRNFSREYEYALIGDEFFIDCIYGVSKHKTLFSFSLESICDILEGENITEGENIFDFSSSISEFPPVHIKLYDGETIILSLNDEIKSALLGGTSNDF